MIVGICGLGLIGGSMAKAYKAAGHSVLGADTDKSTLGYAQLAGIIDGELDDKSVGECDLIFIALYPKKAIEYNESRLIEGSHKILPRHQVNGSLTAYGRIGCRKQSGGNLNKSYSS